MKRRQFLKVGMSASGGLLLSVSLAPRVALAAGENSGHVFNVYLSIATDGRIKITAPVPEIGQGVRTALPMLVAEELEVDWKDVQVIQAPASQQYEGRNQRAAGSNSVRVYWEPMRRAGAVARDMLIRTAADMWSLDASDCRAADGRVIHSASGRHLGYGELAAQAARLEPDLQAPLKDNSNFKLLGTRVPNVDAEAISRGNVTFGTDVRLPNMVFASIERCPVYGGRVVDFDDTEASQVRGFIQTLKVESIGNPDQPYVREGVAVIADNTWAAFKARKQLRISWDDSANKAESTDGLHQECQRLVDLPGDVVANTGDAISAIDSALLSHDATYHVPFIVHTPMETMNCTADVRDDRVIIHVPTQMPAITQNALASRLDLPPEAVEIYPTRVGGGFGRRLSIDFVLEALQLSRDLKRPVQVTWTREDEISQGVFRPFSYHRLRGALNDERQLIAWEHRQASTSRYAFRENEDPSTSEFNPGDIPAHCVSNYRLEYTLAVSKLPRTILRAPGHNTLAFVVQSFIDEMAHLAQADPLEFRLQMLQKAPKGPYEYEIDDGETAYIDAGRLIGVLELAAAKADWNTPMTEGRGRGIACHFTFGSYVAHVIEVSKDPESGQISVDRVVAAVDCGEVANLAGLEAQVEGGVIDGLSAAFYGEITVANGQVEQSNFHNYRLLRFDEAPKIAVHVVASKEAPTGMGEPPYPPVAPALCNAIFVATGTRHRRLPLIRNQA